MNADFHLFLLLPGLEDIHLLFQCETKSRIFLLLFILLLCLSRQFLSELQQNQETITSAKSSMIQVDMILDNKLTSNCRTAIEPTSRLPVVTDTSPPSKRRITRADIPLFSVSDLRKTRTTPNCIHVASMMTNPLILEVGCTL